MIRPNIPCVIISNTGYTVYGEAKPGKRTRVKCNIVRFNTTALKTSVRADSSASRGISEEETFDAVILLPLHINVAFDNVVEIQGEKLKVKSIHKRYDVHGKPDHYEVGLITWD